MAPGVFTARSLVLLAGSVLALAGCGERAAQPAAEAPELPVHMMVVEPDRMMAGRFFVGQVEAASTVDLAFQVGGRLQTLPVQEGQTVPAGQLLAALDPTDFRLQVEKAEVAAARAARDLERGRQLNAQGFVSEAMLDGYELAAREARLTLEQAQRNLGHARLAAPFDALVTRRLQERHAMLQAGAPVLRVHNLAELRMHVHVPEMLVRHAGGFERHRAHAVLDESTGEVLELQYLEHAAEADPVSQTYRVSFAMPRPQDRLLLPGMTLPVRISAREALALEAIWIPLGALDTSAEGVLHVWRYDEGSGSVSRQRVLVGNVRNDAIMVVDGLRAGDRIVTAGVAHLHEGQRVRPFSGY